MAQIVKIV